jgi:hypothetical protein
VETRDTQAFWLSRSTDGKIPRLFLKAMKILCVPVTNATVDRNMCNVRNIRNSSRYMMGPRRFANQMFSYCNNNLVNVDNYEKLALPNMNAGAGFDTDSADELYSDPYIDAANDESDDDVPNLLSEDEGVVDFAQSAPNQADIEHNDNSDDFELLGFEGGNNNDYPRHLASEDQWNDELPNWEGYEDDLL